MPVDFNPTNAFNANTILRIIENNKKTTQEERLGPNIAFLPEGRHSIRWFLDPMGELFREVVIGRVGKKRFVCPDFLARTDREESYPSCRLDEIAKARDLWKDKCRYHCLAYGFLCETNKPSDYWVVQKPYVIIGNSYLKYALVHMLENLQSLSNGMDMLLTMLTPISKGFYSSVIVTKGQKGSIAIQVLPATIDAIALDEWYVPLSEVYIKNEFDKKSYQEAINEYIGSLPPDDPERAHKEIVSTSTNESAPVKGETIIPVVSSLAPVIATPTVATINEILDANAVELSPRVSSAKPVGPRASVATKKKPQVTEDTDLPDGITLDMLPTGCPGWGQYTTEMTVCALCEYNIDCMAVGDSRE